MADWVPVFVYIGTAAGIFEFSKVTHVLVIVMNAI